MKLLKTAIAGTMESSDAMVRVEPAAPGEGVRIELESSVMEQYGDSIVQSVRELMKNLEIEDALIVINDKGALDCTLRARVEAAVFRACDLTKNIPWGTKI